jgi:hypothetical protein
MSKNKRLLAASAAALACFGPASALAQISTSAAITGITFTLTDLAPDDGITPSMTLTLVDANASVLAFDNGLGQAPTAQASLQGTGSVTAAGAFGQASATIDENGLRVTTDSTFGAFEPVAREEYVFSVPAQTLVTFTATSDARVAIGDPEPAQATAYIEMNGVFVNDAPGGERVGTSKFNASRSVLSGGGVAPLSASVFSEGPPEFGTLELVVRTDARGLLPIPEPAGWAMLLAGLGVLAGAGRRARVQLTAPA